MSMIEGIEHFIALLGAVSIIITCGVFFYKAQAKRQETVDLLKEMKGRQSTQLKESSQMAGAIERAANSLDKLEKRMIDHERESIESHTKFITKLEALK